MFLKDALSELKKADLGSYLAAEFVSQIMIIREDKGVTLEALSEMSGVPLETISRIEECEEFPTLEVVGKLLGALGYTATVTYEEKN